MNDTTTKRPTFDQKRVLNFLNDLHGARLEPHGRKVMFDPERARVYAPQRMARTMHEAYWVDSVGQGIYALAAAGRAALTEGTDNA